MPPKLHRACARVACVAERRLQAPQCLQLVAADGIEPQITGDPNTCIRAFGTHFACSAAQFSSNGLPVIRISTTGLPVLTTGGDRQIVEHTPRILNVDPQHHALSRYTRFLNSWNIQFAFIP